MSGYQRVREVEGRQHAAGGAPARRHSRPGRLRSNVFMDEDVTNSHEEISPTKRCEAKPVIHGGDSIDTVAAATTSSAASA